MTLAQSILARLPQAPAVGRPQNRPLLCERNRRQPRGSGDCQDHHLAGQVAQPLDNRRRNRDRKSVGVAARLGMRTVKDTTSPNSFPQSTSPTCSEHTEGLHPPEPTRHSVMLRDRPLIFYQSRRQVASACRIVRLIGEPPFDWPRQIEHPCHPGDDGHHMDGLDPEVEIFRREIDEEKGQRDEHGQRY